jgi:hypothetical protein
MRRFIKRVRVDRGWRKLRAEAKLPSTAEREITRNRALINVNMPQAAVDAGVFRYFLSSSVRAGTVTWRSGRQNSPKMLPIRQHLIANTGGETLRRAGAPGVRSAPPPDGPGRPLSELLRARGHLGWRPRRSLRDGLRISFERIEQQVARAGFVVAP